MFFPCAPQQSQICNAWPAKPYRLGDDLYACQAQSRLDATAMASYLDASIVNFRADILRYREGVTPFSARKCRLKFEMLL
jgi:hypothetical protein